MPAREGRPAPGPPFGFDDGHVANPDPILPVEPDDYLTNFARRILQDALTEARAVYWTRRAEQLEAALPRESDYAGQATARSLATRRERLEAQALACRRRALVAMPAMWLPSESA
jgi:hypothetical protein